MHDAASLARSPRLSRARAATRTRIAGQRTQGTSPHRWYNVCPRRSRTSPSITAVWNGGAWATTRPRIDERRHAGVGGANQEATLLHGPEGGDLEVAARLGRLAEPAVVGQARPDVGGRGPDHPAHVSGHHVLVADQRSDAPPAPTMVQRQRSREVTGLDPRPELGESAQPGGRSPARQRLADGDQPHLVVHPRDLAVGSRHHGGVAGRGAVARPSAHDGSEQERHAAARRDLVRRSRRPGAKRRTV